MDPNHIELFLFYLRTAHIYFIVTKENWKGIKTEENTQIEIENYLLCIYL